MDPREFPAQLGSSSQQPINIDNETSRESLPIPPEVHSRERSPTPPDFSPITPPEHPSDQSTQFSPYPDCVTTHYKIVCSNRQEYALSGNVYITYNIRPAILQETTGWYCIVSFSWHDVQAEFECVYHPRIQLFEEFKFVAGSLKGGRVGVLGVHISMWNFVDLGPDLNPKHAVMDDNGNRIMLAIMILRDGSAVRLYGKMVRQGEDEKEVWLSRDERRRLGMPS